MIGEAKAASRGEAMIASWGGMGHFRFPTLDLCFLESGEFVIGDIIEQFFQFKDIPDDWRYLVMYFSASYGWTSFSVSGDRVYTYRYYYQMGTVTDTFVHGSGETFTVSRQVFYHEPSGNAVVPTIRFSGFLITDQYTLDSANPTAAGISDSDITVVESTGEAETLRFDTYFGSGPYTELLVREIVHINEGGIGGPSTFFAFVTNFDDGQTLLANPVGTFDEQEVLSWIFDGNDHSRLNPDIPNSTSASLQETGLETMIEANTTIQWRTSARRVLMTTAFRAFFSNDNYDGEGGQLTQSEVGDRLALDETRVIIDNLIVYPHEPDHNGVPNIFTEKMRSHYYQTLIDKTKGKLYDYYGPTLEEPATILTPRILRNLLVYIDTPYQPELQTVEERFVVEV